MTSNFEIYALDSELKELVEKVKSAKNNPMAVYGRISGTTSVRVNGTDYNMYLASDIPLHEGMGVWCAKTKGNTMVVFG